MSVSKAIKQQIASDWLAMFPQLFNYDWHKFYKIIGPTVAGIALVKPPQSNGYKPHFVSYPLWRNGIKACLDGPLLLQEILDKKRLQFNIPYSQYEHLLQDAVACIEEQVLLPLDKEEVYIRDLFKMINSQFDRVLVKASPAQQAKLYELKLCAALYVDDTKLFNSILNEIRTAGEKWRPELFEWAYGPFDTWLKTLEEQLHHRAAFMDVINTNKADKRLNGMRSSTLKL
jgi:hypothetical protein